MVENKFYLNKKVYFERMRFSETPFEYFNREVDIFVCTFFTSRGHFLLIFRLLNKLNYRPVAIFLI